jgi:hypothetical protein
VSVSAQRTLAAPVRAVKLAGRLIRRPGAGRRQLLVDVHGGLSWERAPIPKSDPRVGQRRAVRAFPAGGAAVFQALAPGGAVPVAAAAKAAMDRNSQSGVTPAGGAGVAPQPGRPCRRLIHAVRRPAALAGA